MRAQNETSTLGCKLFAEDATDSFFFFFFVCLSPNGIQLFFFFGCLVLIRVIKRRESKLLWTSGCVEGCEGGLVKALIMDYIGL